MMAAQHPSHGQRLLALDSLRGIAAIGVAIFHLPLGGPLFGSQFARNGAVMVDFFFVLSGFVIMRGYGERIAQASDLGAFMRRRFWRLYPLHLITLLGFVAIEATKITLTHYGWLLPDGAFVNDAPGSFAVNLLLLQSVIGPPVTFDGPSWSISAELLTYWLFAAVVLSMRRLTGDILPIVLLLSLAATLLLLGVNGGMLPELPALGLLRCIAGFFLGAALAIAQRRSWLAPGWRYWGGLASALLVAGLVVLATLPIPIGGRRLVVGYCALLILALVQAPPEARITHWLTCRPLVWLGSVSYSVYMIHWLLWTMLLAVLRAGRDAGTVLVDGITVPLLDPGSATLIGLGGVVVLLAIAGWAHRAIEERYRHGLAVRIPPLPTTNRRAAIHTKS